MNVLEIVSTAPTPLRFTEMLSQSGQPRGSLHRHLAHLQAEGLVTLNHEGGYQLGTRLLQLASNAWKRNSLRQIAEPFLISLQQKTGETVHLARLQRDRVVYIDKIESNQSVRMHSLIGNASPVYCTGVGKAMMSRLGDKAIEKLIAEIEFQPFTDHTLKDADALLSELAEIRQQGFAEDRQEHELGIRCVAAPVCDEDGNLVCGISITAPAYRIQTESFSEWKKLVIETALLIGAQSSIELGPRD